MSNRPARPGRWRRLVAAGALTAATLSLSPVAASAAEADAAPAGISWLAAPEGISWLSSPQATATARGISWL